MDFFKCPLCVSPLSIDVSKDGHGKFKIEFYCEGGGDDRFSFELATGLSNKDIANLKADESLRKDVKITILERKEEG